MFGLGMPEVLMILAIALIVIGPTKLPELAKTLGRAMGEFKRSAQDLKRSIDMETTLQDIDPPVDEIRKNFKNANAAAKAKEPPKDPPPGDKAPDGSGPETDTADTADNGSTDNQQKSDHS